MQFRDRYDVAERERVSRVTALDTGEDTPTIQSAKEECDINELVRRFGITGQLPTDLRPLRYGDFTDATDFRSAMDAVVAAKDTFMELPGEVRARFHHDPQEFLEFCEARKEDGERLNLEEMRKYGLALPEPVVVESPPMRVEVVNSPTADASAPK